MIIKITTMRSETHLAFMADWFGFWKSLWRADPLGFLLCPQQMDKEARCCRVASDVLVNRRGWGDEGKPSNRYATSSLCIALFLSFCLCLFRLSDDSNHSICPSILSSLHLSENVLALYAFFSQRITQDSFHPGLDIIKWLTENTLTSLHPLPTPTESHPNPHLCQT